MPESISIKRERWKNSHYYSVAREKGRWVAVARWHGKESTEYVKNIVELKEIKKREEKLLERPPIEAKITTKGYRYDITCEIEGRVGGGSFVHFVTISSTKKYLDTGPNSQLSRYLERLAKKNYGDDFIIDTVAVVRNYDNVTGEKVMF